MPEPANQPAHDNSNGVAPGMGPQTATRSSLTQAEEQIIDIYRRTNDAVVYIETLNAPESLDQSCLTDGQPELIPGTGSGVVIDVENKLVLTNLHVINDAEDFSIKFRNGKESKADVLGINPHLDIAILRLRSRPKGLSAVEIGDSSALFAGQGVLAIGNPWGLDGSLSKGIVSGPPRTLRSDNPQEDPTLYGMIQTDAAMNPGNSGGALLDFQGKLIGINTAIYSDTTGSQGLGFAVAINPVMQTVKELLETGRITVPRLGIQFIDSHFGPVVFEVDRAGPAAAAGIQPGVKRKFITARGQQSGISIRSAVRVAKVNGQQIKTADDIVRILMESDYNRPVAITLVKGFGSMEKFKDIIFSPERVPVFSTE